MFLYEVVVNNKIYIHFFLSVFKFVQYTKNMFSIYVCNIIYFKK